MKWLDEIHAGDLSEVGRKAMVLAELKRSNFPVPDGFVITHTTCQEIFRESMDGDMKDADGSFMSVEIPRSLSDQITDCALRLGFPVAVRSSAAMEDLPGASFAGLYETFLNVGDKSALLRAFRKCWASNFSERLRRYLECNGISRSEVCFAVMVQKQVPAEVAGVLFTMNPVTGHDREMVIEAVSGLGEDLVSGRVKPERYVVDAFSERVSINRWSVEEAYEWTSPPAEINGSIAGRLLNDETLLSLRRLALQIQVRYGVPQDIEWAFAQGNLFILQARPITRICYQGISGEWTTADFRDGGVAAQVVTPFMWSLYKHVWERALPRHLARLGLISSRGNTLWSHVFFSRPYWNIGAVKESLARLPGYRERNLDQELGIEITYDGDGEVTPFRWRGIPKLIRIMLGLERTYFTQWRRARTSLQRFELLERTLPGKSLSSMDDHELCELFTHILCHCHIDLEEAYFQTVFTTANARLDFKAALDDANKHGAGLECLALIADLRPLATLRPLHALWEISRAVRLDREAMEVLGRGEVKEILTHRVLGPSLRQFLAAHGYHGSRELDLMFPRWGEDPTPVIEILKKYVGLDGTCDPGLRAIEKKQRAAGEREKLYRFLNGRDAIRRKLFLRKLDRVRFYSWYREEVRDRSTRMYGLIRKVTLEVGRRLVQRGILKETEDLFFLPYEEVINLLRDKNTDRPAVRQSVAANRNYHLSFRNFKAPNEVGQRWQYRDDQGRQERFASVHRGIPCAPGKVSGRARIVPTMGEGGTLTQGEILVTRYTDPGWTPLFPLVAGIVTETGGVLSHAAIMAREYGIPAVLAVPEATTTIMDGQMMVLDGDRGEVRIL